MIFNESVKHQRPLKRAETQLKSVLLLWLPVKQYSQPIRGLEMIYLCLTKLDWNQEIARKRAAYRTISVGKMRESYRAQVG